MKKRIERWVQQKMAGEETDEDKRIKQEEEEAQLHMLSQKSDVEMKSNSPHKNSQNSM